VLEHWAPKVLGPLDILLVTLFALARAMVEPTPGSTSRRRVDADNEAARASEFWFRSEFNGGSTSILRAIMHACVADEEAVRLCMAEGHFSPTVNKNSPTTWKHVTRPKTT
jgi:hypothetical protein